PRLIVAELSWARPICARRGTLGARRIARRASAGRARRTGIARLAGRSRRDRLCRPLRQCDDGAARCAAAAERSPRHPRAPARPRGTLLRRTTWGGILVHQFERARRNRCQWRTGRSGARARDRRCDSPGIVSDETDAPISASVTCPRTLAGHVAVVI